MLLSRLIFRYLVSISIRADSKNLAETFTEKDLVGLTIIAIYLGHFRTAKMPDLCYHRQRFESQNVLALQNISKQLPLRTLGAYTDR